jgi:hypothetical protein
MTTTIRPRATLLGHPTTKLRTMLSCWAKGKRDLSSFTNLKSVALSPAAVLALLGEAHDRGLFHSFVPDYIAEDRPDRENHRVSRLSDAGSAVAIATATGRTSKKVAKRVLDAILANAATLSNDPNALYCVDQIWVFGSYINSAKADVGDLDLVVTRKRLPLADEMNYAQRHAHLVRHYPGIEPTNADIFWGHERWFNKMVYGPRRHRLVFEETMETLVGLHQPCALVFDQSRGGIIEPEYFEHHPESTERSADIRNRLVMPDLEQIPEEFRFVSAELHTPAFIGQTWHGLTVIWDKSHTRQEVQRMLKDIPINGREHFAILVETDSKMHALLHVHRTVTFDASAWHYDMNITCLYMAKDASFDRSAKEIGAEMLWTLFNADVIRLAARRAHLGGFEDINASMLMCRRTRSIQEFEDHIENLHQRWFFERKGYIHLPENQRFGIMLTYEGAGGGYSELFFYDEDDWSRTAIVKQDAFIAWLASSDPDRYDNLTEFHETPAELCKLSLEALGI